MATFIYSAAEKNGQVLKGEREAENEKILASSLKTEGLFPLKIELKQGARFGAVAENTEFIKELLQRLRPISLIDKMFFARNLAVMISAGLSLTKALDALAEELTNPKFRTIIHEVNGLIVKGKSFAESLRLHQKIFGNLFINMIEVGETTGKLTLVLKLLASQMKKDYDLRKRLRGAMIYPAVIILALFGIGTLMMIYVVPNLAATIKELGVQLPLSTRVIIAVSDIVSNYLIWFILTGFAAVFIFGWALKTALGKGIFDKGILKLPLFGALIKKFNAARFCRTLAYLISSGVPIVRSLEITSGVVGNALFRQALLKAAQEIQKGKQLHEILSLYPNIFQPIVVQMIGVGEETGKISDMMLRLALFFEDEVASTTKNFSVIIEPLLMIVIGVVVGFFAVSMLEPIYSSLGNIGM